MAKSEVDTNDISIDEEILNLLSFKRDTKSSPKAREGIKLEAVGRNFGSAMRRFDHFTLAKERHKKAKQEREKKKTEGKIYSVASALNVGYISGIRPQTMNEIRKGLPPKASKEIKRVLGLNDKMLAEMLGTSEKTVQRKRSKGEKFSLVESDRLYRLAHITALAINVLGSEENAKEWLGSAQYDLAGEIPMDTMKTEIGARDVEDALNRLKFGIFA